MYLGWGAFNARRGAKNFSDEEFAAALAYCHERGVRVFLTLNTLVTDRELPQALETAVQAGRLGVDAVLVQDWGPVSYTHLDLTAGNWGDYDWFSGDSGSSYAIDLGLDFESADKERYDWISVHVTPAMTETVDCLERLGLVTRADLVTYRQLYPEDYGADGSSIWQEVPHTGENAVVYTEDTTSAMVSPA